MTMFRAGQGRVEYEGLKRRKAELKDQLTRVDEAVGEARSGVEAGTSSARVLQQANDLRDRTRTQLEAVEAELADMTTQFGDAVASGGFGGGFDPSASISEQIQQPEFQEQIRRLSSPSSQMPNVQIAEIPRESLREIAGGSLMATTTGGVVTPTGGMGSGPYTGITMTPTAPTTVLDLVPQDTYDHGTLPFSQEVLSYTDPGPAPTTPGSTKPAAGIGYADTVTASTTVAGWVKINKQSLADMGQLQSAISSRLLTKLRQKLEGLVLTADGTVTDVTGVTGIKGLLETSGINTVDGTDKGLPEAILGAIAACMASGAQPNAIVLALADWVTLLGTKATGSGEYVSSPFLSTVKSMWDIAFLPSVSLTEGTAVVIDTRACTLLFREGASVIVGQEEDDFLKNRVTLLCETRVLLPVWVPAAVCEIENLGAVSS